MIRGLARALAFPLGFAPAERGAGLGRALMAAAEAWLADRGIAKLRRMVRDGNPARDFHAALGYAAQPVTVFGRDPGAGV